MSAAPLRNSYLIPLKKCTKCKVHFPMYLEHYIFKYTRGNELAVLLHRTVMNTLS